MGTPSYGMHHIHYRTTAPDAAATWWKTMFGATEKARMTTPAGTLRVMLSLVGHNIYVEEVPEGTAGVPATPHRGLEHIGLSVDDIEAAIADITGKGGVLTKGISSPRPGVRICFIGGPDGMLVELIEAR